MQLKTIISTSLLSVIFSGLVYGMPRRGRQNQPSYYRTQPTNELERNVVVKTEVEGNKVNKRSNKHKKGKGVDGVIDN
jgi:hypothetical protein